MLIIDDFTPVPEAADHYASLGLAPIPLHGIVDGKCACRNDVCKGSGKHPIGADWNNKSTSDPEIVRERFRGHRGNIGIALQGKYVLIDADGEVGLATIDTLDPLPDTLTAISGSGKGGHWLYRLAPHQSADKITDRRFAEGVDVKIRGQFVCAPSIHASGNRYQWVNFREPAELPDWLYKLVCKPAVTTAAVKSDSPGIKRVRAYVGGTVVADTIAPIVHPTARRGPIRSA